ncbi:MAG TPA: DNA internalization-related competence protein ComEC/Rec2, partial [Acinetobacter radioresistens]|nr:DNA internalization-related competence protein ComEC/Rec2 [Acinetobacter radioresistens]
CFILLRIYESINRQPAQPAFNWKQRVLTAGKLLIESQGKIFIALFPLVLIFFKQVSWIAPLTNILVIPLLGAVVVPLDILAACLSYIISPLGLLLFHCSDLGLNLGLWILEILDHL